ncbi:hypothetical protein AB0I51_12625 [Streptomyces sp. NPDC050549]|uniref:hypothetical protein n=1 Tax=Streptomyces sp. NPDC050549 TaxID=3155406 RepID=UPI003441AA4B
MPAATAGCSRWWPTIWRSSTPSSPTTDEGFSRSRLDGPRDYDHRLATDANHNRRLIEHLGDEPAVVFGTSPGGIVALDVLTHHPSVVRTLIPYEPATVSGLPDGQTWIGFFHGVYDLYRTSGLPAALQEFRERAFAEVDRRTMDSAADAKKDEHAHANAVYRFEHELRQYPVLKLDIDTLTAHGDRIVPTAGREQRGCPCHEAGDQTRPGRDRNARRTRRSCRPPRRIRRRTPAGPGTELTAAEG